MRFTIIACSNSKRFTFAWKGSRMLLEGENANKEQAEKG
jgi:hypothetical protein